jgi:CP family cyanate transporter-like MFS transporter
VTSGPRRESSRPIAVLAGLAVGFCLTWNVSNVGAVADPLADAYGVSLPAIGLLTTALFVTHLLVQLPSGRGADRYGARAVALASIGAVLAGNGLLLVDDAFGLALVGRAVVGLGSGAGFVAGLDLVRAAGGGPVLHGVYGASTMTGGGLALMLVPPLTDADGWRTPYWSAVLLALLALGPTLAATRLPRVDHGRETVLGDRGLVPLGVIQAASFGLAVIAGNWAVPLLERRDASSAAAGLAAGLILFAGVGTRPLGGTVGDRRVRSAVAFSLVTVAAGSALLALELPYAVALLGSLVLGLGAGLPFAILFAAAQHRRPDAPASAVAFVNATAILTILVGTPLAGLAFELPGDGAAAFAAIAALALAALLAVRRAPLERR